MHQLHVHLLGNFAAHQNDGTPIHFALHKEEELFCYLVLKRDKPHSREALASLLWSETTTAQSMKYLRTALWHLRTDLGCNGNGRKLLQSGKGWIQLHSQANIWTDVYVIEHAYELARGLSNNQLTLDVAQALEQAIELYNGKLLASWFEGWCVYERERVQHLYLELVDKLMGYYSLRRAFEKGIELGLCLLGEEPARESTHRRLMRLYAMAGDRSAALHQYAYCQAMLREHLDVAPSILTQALYEQIQAGQTLTDLPSPAWLAHGAVDQLKALQDLGNNLEQLQTLLGTVSLQIREIMQRQAPQAPLPVERRGTQPREVTP